MTVGTELVVQENWKMSGSFSNSSPSRSKVQIALNIPCPQLQQRWYTLFVAGTTELSSGKHVSKPWYSSNCVCCLLQCLTPWETFQYPREFRVVL